jgi:glycosyltransferase involved in cell wall biosynthesis
VKAIGRLRTEGAHLVLVGDGPERRSLERMAAAQGLGGRVHFTGFLKPDRIPAALSHGDVLVLPSVYEELGRVVLEGMHAGIPIVATTVGCIPEVLRDGANGLLVGPGDADGLARGIDAVLSRPDLAAHLREAARRDLAPYDAGAFVDRVIEAYREAMLRRGPPLRLPERETVPSGDDRRHPAGQPMGSGPGWRRASAPLSRIDR